MRKRKRKIEDAGQNTTSSQRNYSTKLDYKADINLAYSYETLSHIRVPDLTYPKSLYDSDGPSTPSADERAVLSEILVGQDLMEAWSRLMWDWN